MTLLGIPLHWRDLLAGLGCVVVAVALYVGLVVLGNGGLG